MSLEIHHQPVQNLFTETEAAERYHRYRPRYHHIPFRKLYQHLGRRVGKALDVACGTGHSTLALAELAEQTVGLDISPAMLAEAKRRSNLQYIEGSAEQLPFPAQCFELINISMGVHWLDQTSFLNEAQRVLKPGGVLLIDNYGFAGRMVDGHEFDAQHRKFYQEHLPSAPRHSNYPLDEELARTGFNLDTTFAFDHDVEMSLTAFVNYLMTQSNFLRLSLGQKAELAQKIPQFYQKYFDEPKKLIFLGMSKLYRRS